MLVGQLPRESALARAIDPALAEWTTVQELLALIAELIDKSNRMTYRLNSDKTASQPDPLRVRRPHEGELAAMATSSAPVRVVDNPRMASVSEIKQFFGADAPADVVRYFPDPGTN